MDLDEFADDPPPGAAYQWGLGVAVAALNALMAASIAWSGRGTLPGLRRGRLGGQSLVLTGTDAWLYAAVWLGAAIFVHTHYFWGNVKGLQEYSHLGKLVGLVCFVGCLAAVVVRQVAFL